jgi:DNA-binding transcriptional MerR regulator
MPYTVKDVAAMSGLTPRTLRHYDAVGLLRPSARSEAGYRLYAEAELLRLQQILLYRELELPLADIARVLDAPSFDAQRELEAHKERLARRAERLLALMDTVDRTIAALGAEPSAEEDWSWLYEGFSRATAERWESEAAAHWGGGRAYDESRRRLKALGKEGFRRLRARGEGLEAEFAALYRSGAPAAGPEARELAGRWAAYVNEYYEAGPDALAGLGRLYAEHPEFRERYEAMAPGLADWLRDALVARVGRRSRPKP